MHTLQTFYHFHPFLFMFSCRLFVQWVWRCFAKHGHPRLFSELQIRHNQTIPRFGSFDTLNITTHTDMYSPYTIHTTERNGMGQFDSAVNVFSDHRMKHLHKATQTTHHSTQIPSQPLPLQHECSGIVDSIYRAFLALILKRKRNNTTRAAHQNAQKGRSMHYPACDVNNMNDTIKHEECGGPSAEGLRIPHINNRVAVALEHTVCPPFETDRLKARCECVLSLKQAHPALKGPGGALKSSGGALKGSGGALKGFGGALKGSGGALKGSGGTLIWACFLYSLPNRTGCSIADQNTHTRTKTRRRNAILFMCITKFETLQYE